MSLTPKRAREIQAMRVVRRGGRPSRQQAAIRAALEAGMPTAEVIAALRDSVLDGKNWAITLWLAYAWGRPAPGDGDDPDELAAIDPATLSDGELAAIVRTRAGAPPLASPAGQHAPPATAAAGAATEQTDD